MNFPMPPRLPLVIGRASFLSGSRSSALACAGHPTSRCARSFGGDTYKNWRLNGEFVPDPDDDPTRYHGLAAGDLVVFAFDESKVKPVPESIALVLVSQAEADDARVLADLQAFLGTGRMALLPPDVLGRCPRRRRPITHPRTARHRDGRGAGGGRARLHRGNPQAPHPAVGAAHVGGGTGEGAGERGSNGRDGEVLVNIHLQPSRPRAASARSPGCRRRTRSRRGTLRWSSWTAPLSGSR